jgi:hypothetical protein
MVWLNRPLPSVSVSTVSVPFASSSEVDVARTTTLSTL